MGEIYSNPQKASPCLIILNSYQLLSLEESSNTNYPENRPYFTYRASFFYLAEYNMFFRYMNVLTDAVLLFLSQNNPHH